MLSTFAGLAVVAAMAGWHMRTRRHRNWSASTDGRFFVGLGYPQVAIAAFWLLQFPAGAAVEWAPASAFAASAMICFATGFAALNTSPG